MLEVHSPRDGQGGINVAAHVEIDSSAIDQLTEKALKLVSLLSEAKAIADDIAKTASKGITVSTRCQVPD